MGFDVKSMSDWCLMVFYQCQTVRCLLSSPAQRNIGQWVLVLVLLAPVGAWLLRWEHHNVSRCHTRTHRMVASRPQGRNTLYCRLSPSHRVWSQVCQCWRRLASRMGLSCYTGYIESQEKSNSASLRLLLRLWSSARPESYTVKGLKRVLAAEVNLPHVITDWVTPANICQAKSWLNN